MAALTLIGNVSIDVVNGSRPRVGGSVFHGASAVRVLGASAKLATQFAPEHRGPLLHALAACGYPVTWRESTGTAHFELRYRGEARDVVVRRIGPQWAPADVTGWAAAALSGAGWVHVGALLRDDFPVETLAALARRRRLVVDAQGLARRRRLGPVQLEALDPRAFSHIAVLKLAEDEAAELLGHVDERTLRELGVPEVVVTLGSRGSVVLANGRLHDVPAVAVAADPTGAGDAFTAAYAASRAAGLAPAAAGRRATVVVAALLRRRRG